MVQRQPPPRRARTRAVPDDADPLLRISLSLVAFLTPLIMAGALIYLVAIPYAKTVYFPDGLDTTATIVQVGRGTQACSLTVEFNTPAGPFIQPSTNAEPGMCGYQVGQTVDITYSQSDPTRWRLPGISPGALMTFGFISVFLAAMLFGAVTGARRLIRAWRTRHTGNETSI